MRIRLIFLSLFVVATVFAVTPAVMSEPPAAFETRCGWFSNPTPANIWFYDRDGEWTIGTQGGYQVPGDIPWPKFKRRQWIKTNVADYGYGCACLRLRVDKETHEVREIQSAHARTLAQCRNDPTLAKWKRSFR